MKALGETTIYLQNDTDFPYDKVDKVESGSTHRLSGPISAYLFATVDGITFKVSVDLEKRENDGTSVSNFDANGLMALMRKLSPEAKRSFVNMLFTDVLPGMEKYTNDVRQGFEKQENSLRLVKSLIDWGNIPIG